MQLKDSVRDGKQLNNNAKNYEAAMEKYIIALSDAMCIGGAVTDSFLALGNQLLTYYRISASANEAPPAAVLERLRANDPTDIVGAAIIAETKANGNRGGGGNRSRSKRGGRGRGGGRGGGGNQPQCYRCGEYGHMASTCTAPAPAASGNGTTSRGRTAPATPAPNRA
jgi:uncharacterized membrane protein YgcG